MEKNRGREARGKRQEARGSERLEAVRWAEGERSGEVKGLRKIGGTEGQREVKQQRGVEETAIRRGRGGRERAGIHR